MSRNERGSILLTMTIGLALLVLVLGTLNWLNISNQLIRFTRQKLQVENASRQLISAVETCLVNLRNGSSTCPQQSNLIALMWLPNTNPGQVTFTWSDITTTAGFLSASELSVLQTGLSDATVTISRDVATYFDAGSSTYKSADVMNGSTLLNITVQATPATGFFAFNNTKTSKTFRATIQSPVSFAILLRKSNTTPKLNLSSGSKLSVYGKVLSWDTSALVPSNLISAAQLSQLLIDRFFTTAPNFSLPSLGGSDQQIFDALRASGMQTNFLNGASDPYSGSNASKYDDPLDYEWVYNNGGGGYPLPVFAGQTTGHGSQDPRDVIAANANIFTFPNSAEFGAATLEDTCTRPNNFTLGSIKTLILNRLTSDIVIDYSVGNAKFACGQIVAKTITLNVPSGVTAAWYGNLIATQITVTGGGSLSVVNPFSYSRIPNNLPFPNGMDASEIMQLFMSLDSSTGHNFFVPFARNGGGGPPGTVQAQSLNYATVDESDLINCKNNTSVQLCLCAPSPVTKLCWKSVIQPPDLTTVFAPQGGQSCNGSGGGNVPASCWSERIYYMTEEEN